MAETQRLSTWGWFVRAFAGGFGAMFGVTTALVCICVFGYALMAAGALAATSFGTVSATPVSIDTQSSVPWLATPPQVDYAIPSQIVDPNAANVTATSYGAVPASIDVPASISEAASSYEGQSVEFEVENDANVE
jgi:hypothetical protein